MRALVWVLAVVGVAAGIGGSLAARSAPLTLAPPEDTIPGAPALQAAQAALEERLAQAAALGRATARLQASWLAMPALPEGPCAAAARVERAWRIERFGAGWREVVQAARAEDARVQRLAAAPTISPLVDARWLSRLERQHGRVEDQARRVLEASAWQAKLVRPLLAKCPAPSVGFSQPGVAQAEVPAREDVSLPVAVWAPLDGLVCVERAAPTQAPTQAPEWESVAAGGRVIWVPPGARACWTKEASCAPGACVPRPVEPGAVVAEEPPPVPAPQAPPPPATEPAE